MLGSYLESLKTYSAYRPALFMCKNAQAVAELFTAAGYDEEEAPKEVSDLWEADLRLARYLKTGK